MILDHRGKPFPPSTPDRYATTDQYTAALWGKAMDREFDAVKRVLEESRVQALRASMGRT